MTLNDRYGFSQVINAAGSLTPVGVSRSSAALADGEVTLELVRITESELETILQRLSLLLE